MGGMKIGKINTTLDRYIAVCGVSGDVHGETVDSWEERLSEILSSYSKENIWNMDETEMFWKALPDLAVCMDIHGENWQEIFLQQIGQSETEEKEDEDDEEMNDDYPTMQVKTYQEAVRALEDAQSFYYLEDT